MGLTVKELSEMCNKAVQDGYGDKEIMIPSDDEGNDWHYLLYAFTTSPNDIGKIFDIACVRANEHDVVLLG